MLKNKIHICADELWTADGKCVALYRAPIFGSVLFSGELFGNAFNVSIQSYNSVARQLRKIRMVCNKDQEGYYLNRCMLNIKLTELIRLIAVFRGPFSAFRIINMLWKQRFHNLKLFQISEIFWSLKLSKHHIYFFIFSIFTLLQSYVLIYFSIFFFHNFWVQSLSILRKPHYCIRQ